MHQPGPMQVKKVCYAPLPEDKLRQPSVLGSIFNSASYQLFFSFFWCPSLKNFCKVKLPILLSAIWTNQHIYDFLQCYRNSHFPEIKPPFPSLPPLRERTIINEKGGPAGFSP